MNILLTVMRAALMTSKTMSAVGVTIVIGYGIVEFIRKRHAKETKVHDDRVVRRSLIER